MTMRGKRFVWLRRSALFAVSLLLLAGGAWWLMLTRQADRGGQPSTPSRTVTAAIEKRALSSSLQLPATYRMTDAIQVRAGSTSADAIGQFVTGAPPALGSKVKAGDVVAEVNYRPILLIEAERPFFREIRPGTSGGDVENLQQGLRRMGQKIPEREVGTFGSATQRALRAVYLAKGYDPPDGTSSSTEEPPREGDSPTPLGARQSGYTAKAVILQPREVVAVPSGALTVGAVPVNIGQEVQAGSVLVTLTQRPVSLVATVSPTQASSLDGNSVAYVSPGGDAGTCTLGAPRPADGRDDVGGLPEPDVEGEESTDTTIYPPSTAGGASIPAAPGPGASVPSDLELPVTCSPTPSFELVGTETVVTVEIVVAPEGSLVIPATALIYGPEGKATVTLISKGRSTAAEVVVMAEANGYVAVTSTSPLVREGAEVAVGG